jgi:phosphoribosylanthranilate isomerase
MTRMGTWIKICGTTTEHDADVAIRAGAHALGFILARSTRQVASTAAYSIGRVVPKHVEKIGVFVNEAPEEVARLADYCGFTGVQLHGDEDAAYIARIRELLPGRKILKAVRAAELNGKAPAGDPDFWLLDSGTNAQRGGTGKPFDWKAGQPTLKRLARPVIVAGGLNCDNVQQALGMLRPWGVDVVSGVESYPGHKHPGLVARFIDLVREFDVQNASAKSANTGRSR